MPWDEQRAPPVPSSAGRTAADLRPVLQDVLSWPSWKLELLELSIQAELRCRAINTSLPYGDALVRSLQRSFERAVSVGEPLEAPKE